MLLALLALFVIFSMMFAWFGMLPYGLITSFHWPRWLVLAVILLLTAWLVDD